MSDQFDFIGATDKPALLAFSTPEWLEGVKAALQELGYKIHTAATHSDFLVRFSQVRYQVVIVEERFAANTLEENLTLRALQDMTMSQRRHQHLRAVPGQAAHRKGRGGQCHVLAQLSRSPNPASFLRQPPVTRSI